MLFVTVLSYRTHAINLSNHFQFDITPAHTNSKLYLRINVLLHLLLFLLLSVVVVGSTDVTTALTSATAAFSTTTTVLLLLNSALAQAV